MMAEKVFQLDIVSHESRLAESGINQKVGKLFLSLGDVPPVYVPAAMRVQVAETGLTTR